MPVVLKCHHCQHEARMLDEEVLEALQSRGMLKREKEVKPEYARELLNSISGQLECAKCHSIGVEVTDDWEDDWSDEVLCLGCKIPIDPLRLEVFPDTKYCPSCQSAVESGGAPGEEAEYCESCGGILKLAKRGGSGLAGYGMVCSDCGKRA